jgi:Domain of unknown function (DUF4396)
MNHDEHPDDRAITRHCAIPCLDWPRPSGRRWPRSPAGAARAAGGGGSQDPRGLGGAGVAAGTALALGLAGALGAAPARSTGTIQTAAPARSTGTSTGMGTIRTAAFTLTSDVASLTVFEVGLFGWMALMTNAFFPAPRHPRPDSAVYWFLMQIGMIAGFFTAWPVNTWFIRAGIKEAM